MIAVSQCCVRLILKIMWCKIIWGFLTMGLRERVALAKEERRRIDAAVRQRFGNVDGPEWNPGPAEWGESTDKAVVAGGLKPAEFYEQAKRRVGESAIEQLKWLLVFAQGSRERMRRNIALGFRSTLAYEFSYFCSSDPPFQDSDVIIAAADRAAEGVHRFVQGHWWEFDPPESCRIRKNEVFATKLSSPAPYEDDAPVEVQYSSQDLIKLFLWRVKQLLESQGPRITFCRHPGCDALFLRRKRAIHCHAHRGGAQYARRWRARQDPAKLKAHRASLYEMRKKKRERQRSELAKKHERSAAAMAKQRAGGKGSNT